MAFAEKDTKILWGRAAGMCSNPSCRVKLTAVGANGESFLTGEMAHKIAQSPKGPRGRPEGGADTYDNLILLCPTCHRMIDKSPEGTFTVDQLNDWKKTHEDWVDSLKNSTTYQSLSELGHAILGLLNENRVQFEEYGPRSNPAIENPGSTAHALWEARKLDTLIPNNQKIVAILDANKDLLNGDLKTAAAKFKAHAQGFEDNQYERVEAYPLFPSDFQSAIEEITK